MFCIHCGKENPEESTYCLRCGEKLVRESGNGNGPLILAGCAAAVSLIFGLMSLYSDQLRPVRREAGGAAPTPTLSPAASPTAPPTEVELLPNGPEPQNIVNESMTIEPKSYRAYRFEIAETTGTARVAGEVTAFGGGKDDIYLLILDDLGLEDFREKRDFGSYLRTRVTGTMNISTKLPAGTYHLVLSNLHARFYPKRVRADLTLNYE